MITLAQVSKSYGARILFEEVNITFHAGNRYGLTGPNGAGKSTLMQMIMQLEELTSGSISLPDRVGVLKQNIEDFQEDKVMDCVIMGNESLWKAFQERDALYEQEMTDEVGMRLGDLEEIIAQEDGYSCEALSQELLLGMGIEEEEHEKTMHELSTDKQFRVLLCQALFGEPQALLLDEPTNHLDLSSIKWLESFLFNYKGVMVVTSHDRHFLNSVTTHIADIDYETIVVYPGNYDQMVSTKLAIRERQMQDIRSREKKISQLKEFVSRFSAGSRASQVQSRMREIKKNTYQDLKKSNIQRPYIRFIPSEKKPGSIILRGEKLSKAYGDQRVIQNFSLEVARGDKIGIIGNNGMGKTTLLKMLQEKISIDSGQLQWGHQVIPCYFPQNHEEILDKNGLSLSAFEWLAQQKKGINEQDIRSVLGKMLFAGDDAHKKVTQLSGGETARVILASMMLQEHNVLFLDEPNNHLDLESVSALAWGLKEYAGTCVLVSHDRDLVSQVANKIIAIENDSINVYDGTLEEYLKLREEKENQVAG